MASTDGTAQLQADVRQAVVRVCREKFGEGVEVDGIICICRSSSGEQFVVKLHDRVANGLSKLCDVEAEEVLHAKHSSNRTSAPSFFADNGLFTNGARHEMSTSLRLPPQQIELFPAFHYHHQQQQRQQPSPTSRSPFELSTSTGGNVTTTPLQYGQSSLVSLWTPELLSTSHSSQNVTSITSSTSATPAGLDMVKTECDDEQHVLDYSSRRCKDESSFNAVSMSLNNDTRSPPTESACSDEDDLIGTRRLKSLLSRPSSLKLTSVGAATQVPFLSLRRPHFFNQPTTTVVPECKPCYIVFSSVELLRDHNETVHAASTCPYCYRAFMSRSNLERHFRLHTGLKPYVCVTCGKAFSRKDHLSNHATKHDFRCGHCLKRLANRTQLQQHYQNKHKSALQHVCVHCNKGFSDTTSYSEHQKMHPDRRRGGELECAHCDFSSNDRLVILKHSRLHTKPTVDYSIHCSECDEDFQDPVTYSEHASVHQDKTGVFVCVICGFRPNTYDELRAHEGGHNGGDEDRNGERMPTSPKVSTTHTLPCSPRVHSVHLKTFPYPNSSGNLYPSTTDAPRVCSVCHIKFENDMDLRRHEHVAQHSLGRRTLMKRKMVPRMERAKEKEPRCDVVLPVEAIEQNEASSTNIDVDVGRDCEEDNSDENEEDEGGAMIIDEDTVVVQPESPEETAKHQLHQRVQLHFPHTKSPDSGELPQHWSPPTGASQFLSSIVMPPPPHSNPLVQGPLLPPPAHPSMSLIAKPTPLLQMLGPGEWSLSAAAAVLGGLYVCSICNSQFAEFANCESHCVSAHTRFPCMFCERTFAQKANRDRHTCIHTGQRPYTCSLCGGRFARGDKLKLHKQKMHEVPSPTPSSTTATETPPSTTATS